MDRIDAKDVIPNLPLGDKFDVGYAYGDYPRFLGDIDGDHHVEYGRAVGSPHEGVFLAFAKQKDGVFTNELQFALKSTRHLDFGYPEFPRFLEARDDSGQLAYCRYVGNYPEIHLAVNLPGPGGFDLSQFNIEEPPDEAKNAWWWLHKIRSSDPTGVPPRILQDNPFCCIETEWNTSGNSTEFFAYNRHPSNAITVDFRISVGGVIKKVNDRRVLPKDRAHVYSGPYSNHDNRIDPVRARFDHQTDYSTECTI